MSEAQQSWIDEVVGEAPEPVEQESTDIGEEIKPEIEAKAEKESKPEAKHEQPQGKGETPYVPIFELYKERDKAKEAQSKLGQQNEAIMELKRQIEDLRNPPKPAPDPEEDPAGYLAHQQEQLKKGQDELKNEIQQDKQQREAAKKRQEVETYIQQAESQFKAQKEDYPEALAHLRTLQYNQLLQQGVDQQQAMQTIFNSEFQQAVNLLAMGFNPAEMMYQRAVQYGYKKPETQKEQQPHATAEQKEELQNLDNALQAAKGAGNKGGKVDLKTLIEAPDEQFHSMMEEIFPGMRKY